MYCGHPFASAQSNPEMPRVCRCDSTPWGSVPPCGALVPSFSVTSVSAQERLRGANGPLGPFDMVKVSHHGSADQSAALYIEASATVGLIGVGIDNGYGHPNAKLLGMLRASGTVAARTDLDGLVLMATAPAGGTLTLWRERSGADDGD
jgi:hypothetical protein